MRFILSFLLFLLFSCSDRKKAVNDEMSGNWFVLYPKEDLRTQKQEEVYAETQDSLTGLKCLKLLRFSPDGKFKQLDSVLQTGSWGMKDKRYVQVLKGGKGFDAFRAELKGYDEKVIRLTELVETHGEKLSLTWHLKRIDEGFATALFDETNNSWRYKPAVKETDAEIRKRLVSMLDYYSLYFKLIAEETNYFMPGRIQLPLQFYQHAIGLKAWDPAGRFAGLFYSAEQAQFAYYMLKGAISKAKFDFKSSGSFSAEYAQMLDELARLLK